MNLMNLMNLRINEFTNLCPLLLQQEETYVNTRRIGNHYGFVNIIRVAKNGTKTFIVFKWMIFFQRLSRISKLAITRFKHLFDYYCLRYNKKSRRSIK